MFEWAGLFSLNLVFRRKADGSSFTISNIYGPTCDSLKSAFFQELRHFATLSVGVWTMIGDFNVLLSSQDKNGPISCTSEILAFRDVILDLGLIDLPLLNKSFTWSNGRRQPTLDRLDRAFMSVDWHATFPCSTLRALPRPRSDHSPLLLSAFSFIPSPQVFRFESFWLRYPGLVDVVNKAWVDGSSAAQTAGSFSSKIARVQKGLRSWRTGLVSKIKKQALLCLTWIEWIGKAEELRLLTQEECALRPLLKERFEELSFQEEIK